MPQEGWKTKYHFLSRDVDPTEVMYLSSMASAGESWHTQRHDLKGVHGRNTYKEMFVGWVKEMELIKEW